MLRVANAVVLRIANLAYSFPFTRPLRRGSLLKKVLPGVKCIFRDALGRRGKPERPASGRRRAAQAATSRLTFCPVAVIRASELTLSSPLSLNFPKRCDSLTSANSGSTYAARLDNALRKASVSRYDLTLFRYSPPSAAQPASLRTVANRPILSGAGHPG